MSDEIITYKCFNLDPVALSGEGQYNLNILKEIEVTESFIGLDEYVRQCQIVETYDDCTTRHYIENMRKSCGCLPLALRIYEQVHILQIVARYYDTFLGFTVQN